MARSIPRVLTDKYWERIASRFPDHPPSPKGREAKPLSDTTSKWNKGQLGIIQAGLFLFWKSARHSKQFLTGSIAPLRSDRERRGVS